LWQLGNNSKKYIKETVSKATKNLYDSNAKVPHLNNVKDHNSMFFLFELLAG
jgi:hypothetical protein